MNSEFLLSFRYCYCAKSTRVRRDDKIRLKQLFLFLLFLNNRNQTNSLRFWFLREFINIYFNIPQLSYIRGGGGRRVV